MSVAICIACFGCGVQPLNTCITKMYHLSLPSPACHWTPDVCLPNGGKIRGTVEAQCTNDKQADHATKKCLAIGGIVICTIM